jgi:long-subunit fatty acid transport protein
LVKEKEPHQIMVKILNSRLNKHLFTCFFTLFITFTSFSSNANPVDLFGTSSKTASTGDAAVASSTGGESLYFNPGRLAFGSGFSLYGGVTAQTASLSLPSGNTNIRDALYSHTGLAFTLPFRGFLKNKVRAGMMLSAPVQEITYIKMNMPAQPFYPYYNNRSQRLILIPGVSFLLVDSPTFGKFGLGFGINYFAGLNGAIIGNEGATRSVEARVFEELEGKATVVVGGAWEIGNFKAGFSFRQAYGVEFHNVSYNHVAGTDLNIDLQATTLYSPHTLSWGIAWETPQFGLELNIVESLWSYYKTPFVYMRSQLPLIGELVGELPPVKFNNTMAFKVGGFVALNKSISVKGGVGYENSMISNQTGVTNLMDGNKLTISSGISWQFRKGMFLHAHMRYQMIMGENHNKAIVPTDDQCGSSVNIGSFNSLSDELPCVEDDQSTWGFQTTNSGYPSISSGGYVFSGGLTLEVRR